MDIQTEMLLNALGSLSPDKRDEYEERAAILEYLAGHPRKTAELLAFQQLKRAEKK